MRGKVKSFNPVTGWGFIFRPGGGPDIFVHMNELAPGVEIFRGDLVEFEVGRHSIFGSEEAKNVELVR